MRSPWCVRKTVSSPGSAHWIWMWRSACRYVCPARLRRKLEYTAFAAPPLFRPFWIEVLLQVVVGHRTFNAVRGHFDVGCPKQRVQDDLAEVFVAPVLVEVRAGETEAASAVGPLDCPRNNFLASARRDDMRVRSARRRGFALPGFIVRFGDEDRRDA